MIIRAFLPVAAAAVLILPALTTQAWAERVQGSGSSFAFPVISAWSQDFLRWRTGGAGFFADNDFVVDDVGVDYEAVGSLAGVMRLAQPDIDFAATDAPLTPEDLAARDLVQFPLVIGGLVAAANLPLPVNLSGEVLAGIYLGRITNWNDPAIAALNEGASLPDLAITPVHRVDGSGSTLTFTQYMTARSADWAGGPGAGTLIDWPAGSAVEGSGDMVAAIAGAEGAVGYVEYGQAVRAGLEAATLDGVVPSPEVFAQTALLADFDPARDFHVDLSQVSGTGAYPLTAATFVLMHRTERSSARTRRALFFFAHALERGDAVASGLGYVPLPDALAGRVREYWGSALESGAGL